MCKVVGKKLWIGRGGDHSRVVGGQRTGREIDRQAVARGPLVEALAQFVVGRDPTSHEQSCDIISPGGSQGFAYQIFNDGMLEGSHEVQSLFVTVRQIVVDGGFRDLYQSSPAVLDGRLQIVSLNVAQDRSLDPAVGEIETRTIMIVAFPRGATVATVAMFGLGRSEPHRSENAVRCETVDAGRAGRSEAQRLREIV